MQLRPLVLIAVTLAALSGCSAASLNREAGSDVDEGGFGNPSMTNTMAMTGQSNFTIQLAQRFAQEVPSTITFAFNSAELSPEARAVLSQQASWIRQFPEVRFRVYGHTDLVGSATYNKALGLRRARAAVSYLTSLGIGSARLEAVASFGKTHPVIATPGPEERNRRTVTEVTGFVTKSISALNGKYAAVVMREYIDGATRMHPVNTEQQSALTGSSK
ncbi:OmpA family protein [Cypionkella sp.]|uniref:OmpA family protein n=1 Tax=Cypionkella sp. TaxID=2811411 RepID=UPI0037529288